MDTFDLVNLIIISTIIIWYLIKNPKQLLPALLFLLLFCLITLNASNRVLGYPDRKWWFFEFSFYLLYPILAFLIIWQFKNQTLWNKIVLFALICLNAYFPVCLFPVTLIRNSWVNQGTQYVIPKWRPASFVTKVTKDTIFVIQMVKDKTGLKSPHVISYYWNRKSPPAFYNDNELLPGSGSMEAQTLNQPYDLILQVMNLF
ncbi:MAG: hypothetical protein ACD_73C00542G0002 [uncultured bacterium]|nr:MAG: hypothetical protein ACD_73C00542G0002 [uncultured bacterium]